MHEGKRKAEPSQVRHTGRAPARTRASALTPEDVKLHLSKVIRARRIELEIGVAELAKLCGVSRWTINDIERAAVSVRADFLPRIATALRWTVADLFPFAMPARRQAVAA